MLPGELANYLQELITTKELVTYNLLYQNDSSILMGFTLSKVCITWGFVTLE